MKMRRYIIKITRTIERVVELDVRASTGADARRIANERADAEKLWRDTRTVDQYAYTTELSLDEEYEPTTRR